MNNQITTKAELLAAMSTYGACAPAVEYVLAAPDTATAREIWLGCADVDWLAWFGARHRPAALEAFAFACADRAVRVYAADAIKRAGFARAAEKLRALAPIVDSATARAGEADAADAARAAAVRPASAYTYAAYAAAAAGAGAGAAAAVYADVRAVRAAARAADAAYTAVSYTADAAAAYAAYEAERRIQLDALHALADAILVGA